VFVRLIINNKLKKKCIYDFLRAFLTVYEPFLGFILHLNLGPNNNQNNIKLENIYNKFQNRQIFNFLLSSCFKIFRII